MRLGLKAEEFFELTPRQFAEMQRHWFSGERQWHRAIAALRADVINTSFTRPKEPVKIEDLLAGERATPTGTPAKTPVRMTAWRRAEVAKGWRAFMSSGMAGYTTVETAEVPPKS